METSPVLKYLRADGLSFDDSDHTEDSDIELERLKISEPSIFLEKLLSGRTISGVSKIEGHQIYLHFSDGTSATITADIQKDSIPQLIITKDIYARNANVAEKGEGI